MNEKNIERIVIYDSVYMKIENKQTIIFNDRTMVTLDRGCHQGGSTREVCIL